MDKENLHQEKDKEYIDINLKNMGTINKNMVSITGIEKEICLFFSYETIIAFSIKWISHIKKNFMTSKKFSNTTSKFQNELRNMGFIEVSEQEFKEKLSEVLVL